MCGNLTLELFDFASASRLARSSSCFSCSDQLISNEESLSLPLLLPLPFPDFLELLLASSLIFVLYESADVCGVVANFDTFRLGGGAGLPPLFGVGRPLLLPLLLGGVGACIGLVALFPSRSLLLDFEYFLRRSLVDFPLRGDGSFLLSGV